MTERLLSAEEILQILDIPRYRLNYLFETRKLKNEDLLHAGAKRVYRESDLERIKKALWEVSAE